MNKASSIKVIANTILNFLNFDHCCGFCSWVNLVNPLLNVYYKIM